MSAGCDEAFTGRHFDQPTMNAALSREMRGAGFHELLFATIRAAGKHATGHRVNDDTIRTAFEADRMLRAEGISMASLPGILSNVAGKLLLNAYQAIATTWQLVCSISIVNDFKLHSRYRLTADGTFDQVGAGGELKHGTLGEQAYGQQAKTYGKILSISREDLINDDLGAFGELPKVLGRNAAIALEKAVYTLLMGPGTFFSAGNNNYFAGATSNLQLSSLQTAEQMMLDAVDDAGYPILLQPVTLLVPTALKTTAFSLVHSTELVGTTTADVLKPSGNPFVGRLNPAASAWLNNANLTGYSALAWYLLGNPVDVAAMEVAFLNGLQYPTIQTAETDFSVLGIQLRCFHDFGVALQDPRGAVKSKGAA
jgi:hypothetical protein